MSEVFKATKNKQIDKNFNSKENEVFKATKNKIVTKGYSLVRDDVNKMMNSARIPTQANIEQFEANKTLKKVQNGEYVAPERIERAAKTFETQSQGWAAHKNPNAMQVGGKEISDNLRAVGNYYSLFKDEKDFKNNKENIDKQIEYYNYSNDEVKKRVNDGENRKTTLQNEISALKKELTELEKKKTQQGRNKGVGAFKKQEYENRIKEIKNEIAAKKKELDENGIAYRNTDGSAVTWKNIYNGKLSNQFKVKNEDGSYRGLTYDEVQEKLKEYDPESDEYKFLSKYTDYSNLNEFNKAFEKIADKDSDYYNELKTAKNIYELDHKFDLYKHYTEAEDFEKESKYVSTKTGSKKYYGKEFGIYADSKYEYINGNFEATQSEILEDPEGNGPSYAYKNYDQLTDEEVKVYNYLYSKNKEKADEFLKDMEVTLGKRATDKNKADMENLVAESSGIEAAIYNLGTIALKPFASFSSGLQNAAAILSGEEINPYATGNQLSNAISDFRQAQSEEIAENTKGKEFLGQNIPSFLYNTAISMGDSVVGAALFGKAGTVLMGADAFQQTAREMKEAGEDNGTILAMATASGIAEMLFEYVEVDNLFKNIDGSINPIKAFMKQGVVESFGEGATEVANIISDSLLRGKNSELYKTYARLKEEGKTDSEIATALAKQVGSQVGWAVAGGFLSGGVMGGVGAIGNHSKMSSVGKVIVNNNQVSQVIEAGLSLNPDSAAYKTASEIGKSKNVTNAQIGKLASDIKQAAAEQKTQITKTAVSNRAQELGASSKEAGKLADFFVSAAYGEDVSTDGLGNTGFVKQIADEIKDGSAPWVEQMNAELETVAKAEQAVADAVTKRYVSPAENSQLQSSAEGDIIENGDDGNGSEDTKLLAGRKVSTAGGSRDGVWQQSENSRKLSTYLEILQGKDGIHGKTTRAGASGWLNEKPQVQGEPHTRYLQGILGNLRGISLNGKDTIGRNIDNEIKEKFKNTVFKDKDGYLISLYHWTNETFDKFAKGEFGFHFGTLDAAHDRYSQKLEEDPHTPVGNYKEVYLNITNPIELSDGAYEWNAGWVALQLREQGIITEEQYNDLYVAEGFYDNTYDNPAANTLRNILKEKGYDGIIYPNDSEDLGNYSVIALDADQILTVAENGVLKENNGVSEADFSESAFSMPESRELFTAEAKGDAQERVKGIAKLLDSDLKVLFVDSDSVQLKGARGKFIRRTNTLFISKDATAAEMYVEVFKHEFVHRLETRRWYQSFKDYLYNKSLAFEKYARAQLKVINGTKFKGSREEALKALADYYYEQYTTDENISAYIRNSFTTEDAQREIVADFAAEVLFKGEKYKKDMAFALAEETVLPTGDMESSIDALEELAQTDRNLFQKVWDTIKDLINALMGRPQTENITADLEYLENRLKQVYDSQDTKKAAKKTGVEQFALYNHKGKLIEVDWHQDNFSSLSQQLQENLDKVNDMSPVATVKFKPTTGKKLYDNVYEAFKNIGFKVDVQNFGVIELDDSAIKSAVDGYINTDAEAAAIISIPKVLKRGRIISGHQNHKNRGYPTITFAAPVELNGKVGNVVVAVKIAGKTRYNAHRVLMPDGTEFVLDNEIDTDSQSARVNAENSNQRSAKESVSSNNISNFNEVVKEKLSIGSPMQKAKENFAKYERGEMTSGEYQESLDELWGEANEKYGSFPTGENAENAIAVPQAVSDDRNTRRFIRTILETGKLTEEMIEDVEQEVLLGDTMSYKVVSDEKAIKRAENAIADGTAEYQWIAAVENKAINKTDIAVGEQLLLKAVEAGDRARVLELSSELSDALTRAGQTVQAARLLKKMSGLGRLMSAQRTVKTLNKSLREKYGDDAPKVNISSAAADRLAKAKTEDGIEYAYTEVLQEVANQMPAIWIDKLNAWRYFAMLANPRTHIRNLIGNGIFTPMVRMKDFLATGAEHLFIRDKNKRTKAVFIKKEYLGFAKQDIKNREAQLALEGKGQLDEKGALNELRRTFKTEWLENMTSFSSDLLEREDMWFKSIHYKHALASFLQARRVDLNNISKETLDEARKYAVKEAKKATFQDASVIADMLNSIRAPRKYADSETVQIAAQIAQFGVEGILPFKRTPINIVKRGVEYGPLGLAETLTVGAFQVVKGKITVSEYCDGLAAGLTGTGIMMIGYFLAAAGWVTGGFGDDEEDKFKQLNGEQEYSINIFGKSYSIDFAAPACLPFFIGAELAEELEESDGFQWRDLSESFWNTLEPMTNLSMLSGIQGLIQSVKYTDNSRTIGTVAGDIATSFAMQLVPSIFGSISRTVDTKQRSWYTDKNSFFDDFSQSAINNVASKIPGASYLQKPKIDAWGREMSRGSVGERIAENFVSPGYYSEIDYTDTDNELKRLFKQTGENVFPQAAKKNFEVNGETKYLTADEYVTYAKAKGQYSYDYIHEFMESNRYDKLDDDEKAAVITNLYKFANAKAKKTVSDYDPAEISTFKTVSKWERNGRSAVDYYISNALKK